MRSRERRAARAVKRNLPQNNGYDQFSAKTVVVEAEEISHEITRTSGSIPAVNGLEPETIANMAVPARNWRQILSHLWHS
ncbi:MAG: hypothetical protein ACRDHW_23115, partial [Ktedonobacteraceae bacterium]